MFFSVAMILGVVAMCSNRVGAGVAVLVSAIGSLALCVVLFMTLVFGTAVKSLSRLTDHDSKLLSPTVDRRPNR